MRERDAVRQALEAVGRVIERRDAMGELRVMGGEGDLKVVWDPDNGDETTAAREQFERLRKKGYNAYAVRERGGKGEMIREFDPDAGKIILAPPMAGG